MTVKTIFGAVLAVAFGGAVLGFASKYRGDCCSNGAKKGIAVTAVTANGSMLSLEGECHGSCALGDASGEKECCQTAGISKSVISQSGKEHEGECHGDCAHGDTAGGKKCCQDVERTIEIMASPK